MLGKEDNAELVFNDELIMKAHEFTKPYYTETHRYYHNTEHVGSLVMRAHFFAHHIKDISLFLVAAFFHDVVHIPGLGKDNEKSSIALLKSFMTYNECSHDDIQYASDLISGVEGVNTTDYYNDICLFHDLDHYVFSNSFDNERYKEGLYREYCSFMENKKFFIGRLSFLNHYLNNKKQLFRSPLFIDKFPDANIEASRLIKKEIEQIKDTLKQHNK